MVSQWNLTVWVVSQDKSMPIHSYLLRFQIFKSDSPAIFNSLTDGLKGIKKKIPGRGGGGWWRKKAEDRGRVKKDILPVTFQ